PLWGIFWLHTGLPRPSFPATRSPSVFGFHLQSDVRWPFHFCRRPANVWNGIGREPIESSRKIERLKAVIDAGVPVYTKEMAIRYLSSISIDYESDRVQTSNISRVPELIAELLDGGYVEKMNRFLFQNPL